MLIISISMRFFLDLDIFTAIIATKDSMLFF
jgi:hypothetical protein